MTNTEGAIETLRDAILRYGERHPERVRTYVRGERVIQQGSVSDVCYLIKTGTLSIWVRESAEGPETEVALRYARELIGETAFLQRGVPRTASVIVFSPTAELIALTRHDLYKLLQHEPALHDSISVLWELAAVRRRETLAVLGGQISVTTRMMSALLADIHNFSTLGEVVWEEELDSFLFDFIEHANSAADHYNGMFEDQGDGFKIVFADSDHASRAVLCGCTIRDTFLQLRTSKTATSAPFRKIGLGVGICSDFMTIRRRENSPRAEGRILSHALNVAAAISKFRESVDETAIYVDETTRELARTSGIAFTGPEDITLEKLGRRQMVYQVTHANSRSLSSPKFPSLEAPSVGSAFISYAHADIEFVDRLVKRLEADGVTIWRDSTNIFVGDDIDRAISRGIEQNKLFLIILTKNSIRSDWVARELDEAAHGEVVGNRVLLPVIALGLTAGDLPSRIRRKKSVVFASDFEEPYGILLRAIKEHTRRYAIKTDSTA